MINLKRIHHVAYRCKDAKKTADWYKEMLNMELTVAIAENEVPSTKAPDPYMHIFLDAGMGNVLAFFEIPNSPEMGRDQNTPAWVQHIAEPTVVKKPALVFVALLVAQLQAQQFAAPIKHFRQWRFHHLQITKTADLWLE